MQRRHVAAFTCFALLLVLSGCRGSDERPVESGEFFVSSVESRDGVRIVYQRKGEGYPPVILVHGWAGDRQIWRKQFDKLAKRYTVVSIDLAGHGESGNEREHFTIEAFAADVKAVVVKERLNSLILAGHSMGGAVVMEAARTMPGRVMGLLGVDTYHDIAAKHDRVAIDSFVVAMQQDFVGTTQPWIRSMFPDNADQTLVSQVVTRMSAADPRVAISAFLEYVSYDHIPVLKEVGLPVYCINSDRYPMNMTPLRQLSSAAAMTPMPGLGHFLMLEDPETFLYNFHTAVNYIRTH